MKQRTTEKKGTSSNPLGFNNHRAILIYDLSILDIAARKSSAQKFDSVQDCAEHFKTGRHNIMRAIGKRWTDRKTSKEYAVRDCGTTEGAPGFGLISAKEAARIAKELSAQK